MVSLSKGVRKTSNKSPLEAYHLWLEDMINANFEALIPIFNEIIKSTVKEAIHEELSKKDSKEIYLTKKEAAAYIKRSESTIDRWRMEGKIQFRINPNGRPVFLKSSLVIQNEI